VTDEVVAPGVEIDESPPRQEALAPVDFVEGESLEQPRDGIALCLSGGGSRAMLFHAGALKRLNELGILKDIDLVSSVSGGSLTAGVLARHWNDLEWDEAGSARNFETLVIKPLRDICDHDVDVPAWIVGFLVPWLSPVRRFAQVLDKHLYGGVRLRDVAPHPEFVINATNLGSTVLWRFSQSYLRDYRVGQVRDHGETIATAVAASSAFPLVFAPLRLSFRPSQVATDEHTLPDDDLRRRIALGDGGIYDNLGLEAAWKRYRTVFVSDGGGDTGVLANPPMDLIRQVYRVMQIIDRQVRSLRKRLLIESYKHRPLTSPRARAGAYWGVRTDIANYELADALPCPTELTLKLAAAPTRLTKMAPKRQEQLMNWGYAVADAGVRRHWPRRGEPWPAPDGFPYPVSGLG
jgi:NTE family protein